MSDPINDPVAERAVLGAALTNPNIIDDVSGVVAGGDFYHPRHESVWNAIVAIHRRGDRPDPVTVGRELGPELVKCGGPLFLAELAAPDVAPIPAQAPYYASIVAEKALGRRVVSALAQGISRVETAADISGAVEDTRQSVDAAAVTTSRRDVGQNAGDLLESTVEAMESPTPPGLPTGWGDLDHYIGGLRPGQLCVIGARPSVGKSVMAANLAAAVCRLGAGVHFASLEMTRQEVMKRMLAAETGVDLSRIMAHSLSENDWQRVNEKAGAVREWPLWVDDTESQALLQLRARARNTARRLPLGMIVVDYLQLMAPRDRRAPREQQVGELSEGLKSLAKELAVPVVALSQVNRGPMDRQDKRPQMSDLRESGRIEADADHVWLLHRPDLVEAHSATGDIEVILAKNRNGPQGATVTMRFQGFASRIVPAARMPTRGIA